MNHNTSPPRLPLIARAEEFARRTAIQATEGTFTYAQLVRASHQTASTLLNGRGDLNEARVAFLVPPGFQYVSVQWGIWRAGGVAVPLCVSHPRPELEYVIDDTGADILITHPDFEETLHPIAEARAIRLIRTPDLFMANPASLPEISPDRRAMILYTSGTTGSPKGVVSTHHNIEAQVSALLEAWGWTPDDRILLVLPLHHVHGIINVLTCALRAGAVCEMLPGFNAEQVLDRFLKGSLTLFMAVPTIYVKLISAWEDMSPQRQEATSQACTRMRLMISGSAALPLCTLEKWQTITSHTLLERYGMTEIGMALSNPLHGERRPGHVGAPLPSVEIRLVDENGQEVEAGVPGEIQVKGPSVFLEYWQRPEATARSFQDGWFRTGDIAVLQEGSYRIMGRDSVDIIKTGGYKVSALEIEETLRNHPSIKECAVVGVEDLEWGERVSAALVLEESDELTLDSLRQWGKERLAPYKVPSQMMIVEDLPRNAMGKVTKPLVRTAFQDGDLKPQSCPDQP